MSPSCPILEGTGASARLPCPSAAWSWKLLSSGVSALAVASLISSYGGQRGGGPHLEEAGRLAGGCHVGGSLGASVGWPGCRPRYVPR